LEEKMKKGFSLIEVLIVIALVFFISCGTIRFLMASNKTGIESNLKTYASVMAHTKFFSLKKIPLANPDISVGWHEDKGNPIIQGNKNYYRFWRVSLNKDGSRAINVYVTWNNKETSGPISSEDDLNVCGSSKIEFQGIRDALMP
jgi:Tfp pilus assembly protein PilE